MYLSKGQIKPKTHLRALDSPKKRAKEFVLFASLLFTANKTNLFFCFLGESTARQSCFWFYLTFKNPCKGEQVPLFTYAPPGLQNWLFSKETDSTKTADVLLFTFSAFS